MSPGVEVYGPIKPERFIYSDVARWNEDLEDAFIYRHRRIEQPSVVSWQCDGFMCSALSKEFSPAFPDPPEFVEVVW